MKPQQILTEGQTPQWQSKQDSKLAIHKGRNTKVNKQTEKPFDLFFFHFFFKPFDLNTHSETQIKWQGTLEEPSRGQHSSETLGRKRAPEVQSL